MKEDREGLADYAHVWRFNEGADQNTKRAFAACLVDALNEVGVEPGDVFVVAPSHDLQGLLDDHANELIEARKDSVALEDLVEAIEDFRRGILTADELYDRAALNAYA